MKTASTPLFSSARSVAKVSRPAAALRITNSSSPGSKIGTTPPRRPSIFAASRSTQTISWPSSDRQAPATSPTYPEPMISNFMSASCSRFAGSLCRLDEKRPGMPPVGRHRRGVHPLEAAMAEFSIEVRDGPPQPHGELDLWRPSDRGLDLGDVRPAPARVVDRQRLVDDPGTAADEVDDDTGEFADCLFHRITQVDRVERPVAVTHQADKAVDQVADVAERPRLLAR